MKLIRAALAMATAFHILACHGQGLEIVPLKHRTVEQVLPTLRPLLDAGATLTGQANQLIIRTSPANLAEILRALEAIDRPARRLEIAVRFDDSRTASGEAAGISGRVGAGGARVEVAAAESSRRAEERVDQRLQVLEGGQAFISTGGIRPLPAFGQPGVVVPQEATTGFAVVPRLSGRTVFLDIAPQRESFAPGGSVRSARVETTISARLGEWTEIGGSAESSVRAERGLASSSRSSATGAQRVWVKVEELRN
jgi:hypothetical protein